MSATIRVADTGIGMSEEGLARVRRPFVQGRQLEERSSPVTGLGLVLIEQLVELHSGAVTLDSAPGKGTTATVTLPADTVIRAREPRHDVTWMTAVGRGDASHAPATRISV